MEDVQEAQMKMLSQMEEMVMDTFNRMKRSCSEKCVKKNYGQTHLVKSEAVCMDRCVAKYMEMHDLVGKTVSRDKDTYDLLAEPGYVKKPET